MENIEVNRGDASILRGIDWAVNPGENWVILGANGSGKTSLLKLLMGYMTPSAGEVRMAGRFGALESGHQNWDEWRKRFGFVSSGIAEMIEARETALDVVRAGRHAMINYWLRDRSREAADTNTARRILKEIRCEHLASRSWAILSQGERQRILIGRALAAPRMDVLVLDEPCAGLDPVARESFLQFVEELASGKKSFRSLIMVTHHVEEIVPAMTHALLLRDGRVNAQGPLRKTLNSGSISETFGRKLVLRSRAGRYRLELAVRQD